MSALLGVFAAKSRMWDGASSRCFNEEREIPSYCMTDGVWSGRTWKRYHSEATAKKSLPDVLVLDGIHRGVGTFARPTIDSQKLFKILVPFHFLFAFVGFLPLPPLFLVCIDAHLPTLRCANRRRVCCLTR